jgi:hypothetical protein
MTLQYNVLDLRIYDFPQSLQANARIVVRIATWLCSISSAGGKADVA